MRKQLLLMITGVIVGALAIVPAMPTVHTSAGTYVVNKCPPPPLTFNAIQSGLWAGVNMDAGGLYTSSGSKVFMTPNGTICSTNTDIVGLNNFNSQVAAAQSASNNQSSATTVTQMPSTSTSTSMTPPAPAAAVHMDPAAATTQTTFSTAGSYVALGDSVAGGLGLANPLPIPSGQTSCGRTRQGYPNQVAASTGLPFMLAACSGATATNLLTKQGNLPAQLNSAFVSGTPKLITVTVGANDAHWSQFAQICYVTNCATTDTTAAANAYLVALQAKLLAAFASIQSRSGGNPPEVIVTGYYNPISAACITSTGNRITTDEVAWMTGEVNALNATIQGVVSIYPSFARFVPIDFTGHDICSSDPWVQGLNDPAPIHPTATGQQVFAQDILAHMSQGGN